MTDLGIKYTNNLVSYIWLKCQARLAQSKTVKFNRYGVTGPNCDRFLSTVIRLFHFIHMIRIELLIDDTKILFSCIWKNPPASLAL